MMKSLKFPSMLLVLLLSTTAVANPLYSWITDDGTPTYSPDPPPKGVNYEIVGADLQPLATQQPTTPVPATPTAQAAPQTSVAPATAGNIVLTPAPGSNNATQAAASNTAATNIPPPEWKPVIYADDPNPSALSKEFPVAAATPQINSPPVSQVPELARLSPECIVLKQQLLMLESQFANAESAQQMDSAVVRLNSFKKQNKGSCGL